MISPKSSLHAHKAVLVFMRARMCGHLPLVAPPNAHRESLRLLSHGFLDATYPGEHERLVEDFMSAANSVAFNTLADDIVGKVFSSP